MGTVKLLSNDTINQIAAGEVVDRPISVIKELVENSLDAGATELTIEISRGGRNLIAVHDNGKGMDVDDLLLAVERHATSKLNEEDINYITNYGFRGEALPSIASVSKLKIKTKMNSNNQAFEISVLGGKKSEVMPASRNDGTTVEVRDIFCFTPARLKFLKSEVSEKSAAMDLINRFALCKSEVGFKLISDNKVVIDFRKDDNLEQRMAKIFGKDFLSNAAYFELTSDETKVYGYAGVPTFNFSTAVHNYVYVNKRNIKDKQLIGAIKGAYQGLIPSGRHPAILLYIELNAYDVDVNVHPAKAEVRFREAEKIRNMLIKAIRQAVRNFEVRKTELEDNAVTAPTPPLAFEKPNYISNISYQNKAMAPLSQISGLSSFKLLEEKATYTSPQVFQPQPLVKEEPKQAIFFEEPPLGYAQFQLNNKFIIAKNKDGLILVDQHAAHERITLQKLKAELALGMVRSQLLLVPHIEVLGKVLTSIILEFAELLKSMGLLIAPFGDDTISISAVPVLLIDADIATLVRDVAEQLAEYGSMDAVQEKLDEVLGNFACHYSIRSGRKMAVDEMNNLLRDIEKTDFAAQCNHGRPTFKKLSLEELELIFERR